MKVFAPHVAKYAGKEGISKAIVGFDSAWSGKYPGAVSWVGLSERGVSTGLPKPASFEQAVEIIE